MGQYTVNNYFYKPSYGATGTMEMGYFHSALDTADSALQTAVSSAQGAIPKTIGTTKGQLIVFTGSATPVVLGASADGTALVCDAASASGMKFDAISVPVKATGAEITTGTDDTKFATAKAIADSGLLFTSFVDRGDPSAVDFAKAALTIDGSYHDLDLSSIVPAGAKAVLLKVYVNHNTLGSLVRFRKNGNTDTYADWMYNTSSTTYGYILNPVVACDANRVVEYAIQNEGVWTTFSIVVRGWWL